MPEIREEVAPADIRAIYADIKSVMHVPFVNLVHRYLATIPDGLPYAWSVARPPMVDGRMDRWTAEMLNGAEWPQVDMRSEAIRKALGDGRNAQAALDIVNTYNYQNPRNVIVFGALARFMRDPSIPVTAEHPVLELGEPSKPQPMPPFAKYSELPPRIQAAIVDLASREHIERDGIVPSLFLHLAAWPELLVALRDTFAPMLAGGAMETAIASIVAGARGPQAELRSPPIPQTVADVREGIATTLTAFSQAGMPRMVVFGHLIAEAIQASA